MPTVLIIAATSCMLLVWAHSYGLAPMSNLNVFGPIVALLVCIELSALGAIIAPILVWRSRGKIALGKAAMQIQAFLVLPAIVMVLVFALVAI